MNVAEKVGQGVEQSVEKGVEAIGLGMQTAQHVIDAAAEYAITYGFQILGALLFLAVGLKVASWIGRRVERTALARQVDVTLSRFLGTLAKAVLVAMLIIITLGNFGITIAPLIALAGGVAFGATVAIQGPLSNYGAGLSIILGRPFVVGDTVLVKGVSGVVDVVKLAATTLIGEDGERITVPNKEIVGQILVNSAARRIVETRIGIGGGQSLDRAITLVEAAVKGVADVAAEPGPQVGLDETCPGGLLIGIRAWVPSRRYFPTRFAIMRAAADALLGAGIRLLPAPLMVASLPQEDEDSTP